MATHLGFVGLGVMGGPMAGHLQAAGHPLTVWNRSPEKARPLSEQGAQIAASLGALAEACDLVFLCVSRTEDVESCLQAMAGARPGTLFVDHSTISPAAAATLHTTMQARGHRFIDAPITGGSVGAQRGQLTIFMGGNPSDIEEVKPYLSAYAKRAEAVGGAGAGQMMKMANQIAVGGALLALCESLSFAQKAGLDVAQARELIGGGAGGSWAFENYGKQILAHDWTPGFSITNQRKDFGYCREAAANLQAAIPGTNLVDRLLAILDERGHGGWTTASLFDALMEMDA